MNVYRERRGKGWAVSNDESLNFGPGWRPATLVERIWHAIFTARFSYVESSMLAVVAGLLAAGYVDWIGWLVILLAAVPVIAILKFITEPPVLPRIRGAGSAISDGIREVFHDHGQHRFCREIEVRVVDHYDHGSEMVVGIDDDGKLHKVDVTSFGGRPVYRTEKRHG